MEDSGDVPVVVYIGGFLTSDTCVSYPTVPEMEKMRVMQINPSGVSSLHDRIMQCFYELKGGVVRYGDEHSAFHGHAESGATFASGKFPEWDAEHPIHLAGHSFGGLTARVFHAYLAAGDKFYGHTTNASWIISVNTMNSPLNGCLMVYPLGANLTLAPVVRWGSHGCIIGWIAHLFEYFDTESFRALKDFKLAYWDVSHKKKDSLVKMLLAFCGISIHSTTDNSAYDMTLQSQKAWQQAIEPTIAGTFYSSTVGSSYTKVPERATKFIYAARFFSTWPIPKVVVGVDAANWFDGGYDGLLSCSTQEAPTLLTWTFDSEDDDSSLAQSTTLTALQPDRLLTKRHTPKTIKTNLCPTVELSQLERVDSGTWYVRHVPLDHLGTVFLDESWSWILRSILTFHKASRQGGGVAKSQDGSTTAIAASLKIHKPDMQIPSWSVLDRHSQDYSFGYSALCFLFGVIVAITVGAQYHGTTGVAILAALAPPIIAVFSKSATSDFPEAYCAFARLVLSIYSLNVEYGSYNQSFSLFLITDAIACLGCFRKFDYAMPMTKIFLALGFGVIPFDPAVTIVAAGLEGAALVAKFGWQVTTLGSSNPRGPGPSISLFRFGNSDWIWTFLWISYLACFAIFLSRIPFYSSENGCIFYFNKACSASSPVPFQIILTLFGFVALLQRLRDFSDAFQTQVIKGRYERERKAQNY